MRVEMLETKLAAPDGANVVELLAGESYDLPDRLAERYLARELAAQLDDDADVSEPAPFDPPPQPPADPPETEEPSGGEEPDSEPAAEEQPADPLAELVALKRSELDKLAKKAKVPEPEKLPNKQAVAEAIIAARG